MLATRSSTQPRLQAPVRNHYFYGKLLDVHHFEMETQYHNAKRWLLNRLVTGYGVVCGLNIEPGAEIDQIFIAPGVAIDKWGREVIVEQRVGPITIPAHLLGPTSSYESEPTQPGYGEKGRPESQNGREDRPERGYGNEDRPERQHGEEGRPERQYGEEGRPERQYGDKGGSERPHGGHEWIQVKICYLECESDPMPVFAGDCDSAQLCAPGTIRERFKIEFDEGRHPMPNPECLAPEVFPNDQLDYASLARFVTRECPDIPRDPCIVLANIRIVDEHGGHGCDEENIDITVRPIVYGNDLIFKLLLSDEAEERDARDYREKG
jgi:hypothetical protein